MAEYITKEAAIQAFERGDADVFDDYGDYGDCYNSGFSRDNIKSTINAIPPFDVAPVVKGRWVSKNTHGYDWVFVCSNCGYVDGYPFNDRHNFCPNCGAKMEQEDL